MCIQADDDKVSRGAPGSSTTQGQTPGIKTPDRQRGQVEPCEREGAASAMPTNRHGCWVLCRPLLAAFEGPGSASGGAAPFFRHLRRLNAGATIELEW